MEALEMFCTYPNRTFQQEPLQSEVLCLCPAQSGPAPLCINQVILMTQTPPWSEVLMLVGMKGSNGGSRSCLCVQPQVPGSRACPACSQDTQGTKPRNDVNQPRKGFPFLESLGRQMCAAAGRHSPTPSKESGIRETCRALLATSTSPRMALEMRGSEPGATSSQAEQHNPPAPSKTRGDPAWGLPVLCTNIPVLPASLPQPLDATPALDRSVPCS